MGAIWNKMMSEYHPCTDNPRSHQSPDYVIFQQVDKMYTAYMAKDEPVSLERRIPEG